MMEPKSGALEYLTAEENERLKRGDKAAVKASVHRRIAERVGAANVGPSENMVMFSEGEEIVVRGCRFRVDAVRRNRLTLTPMSGL